MNVLIKKEYIEFEKHHKNVYNIYFHIICGFIFMTCLCLFSYKYSYILLLLYTIILYSVNNFFITCAIFLILFSLVYVVKRYEVNRFVFFSLFFVFYLLPDLSHHLVNEPSALDMNNITLSTIFINIFYLLPFSVKCLFYSK